MGLILDGACGECGYEVRDLRLGGSHAQIAAHDVSAYELFRAACCQQVQSVLVYLGQGLPDARCEGCDQPLPLAPEQRYRVATLKGEAFGGHGCPRCARPSLTFVAKDRFV